LVLSQGCRCSGKGKSVSFPDEILSDVVHIQFDFPAVAQGLGIKTNAARMRYMRLKSKIEAMGNEVQKGTAKTELEENGQPESESHEQRKVKEELEEDEAAQL
jgi:hypothetical protein